MKIKGCAMAMVLAMSLHTACGATMFTLKFSSDDIKLSSGNLSVLTQFDKYPIKYTLDGSDLFVNGEILDKSKGLELENGVYKLSAAVFNEEVDEQISDVYQRVVIKGVKSSAIQTDKTKIVYDEYEDDLNRYPHYAFDGEANFSDIGKAWTVKSLPITVNYDNLVKANMLLITFRAKNNVVTLPESSESVKLPSKSDISISIDIRYKDAEGNIKSATDGAKIFKLPKNSMLSYSSGAVWGQIVADIGEIKSDEIIFDVKSAANIDSIKEIELFNANEKKYRVRYSISDTKVAENTSVAITGLCNNKELSVGEYITYTTDGTNPDSNSDKYENEIPLTDGIVTIKAAIFNAQDEYVSDVFGKTYIVGTHKNNGVQTDVSKIAYDSANLSGSSERTPKYAFDGVDSFDNVAQTMEWNKAKESVWVDVQYSEPLKADKLLIPVRVRAAAYEGNQSQPSLANISLHIKLTEYNDDGTVKSEQTKMTKLPSGSDLIYANSGMWATLPVVELQKINTKKIKIEILSDGTENIESIKEFEFYNSAEKTYSVTYTNNNTKISSGDTVSISSNAGTTEKVRYTIDGTAPDSASALYDGSEISLPNGVVKVQVAIFDSDNERVSEVFSKTYIVGNCSLVGTQTDASKIVYGGTFNNARTPVYAFDGISAFENVGQTMEWNKNTSSAWAEVSYNEQITADTLVVPVRLRSNAYNFSTNEEISTADVKMTLTLTLYNDDGTVKGTQNKVAVLPTGSALTYSNNAMWAILPAIELDEFTAKKIKIEVFTETPQATAQCVDSVKEFEFYYSK